MVAIGETRRMGTSAGAPPFTRRDLNPQLLDAFEVKAHRKRGGQNRLLSAVFCLRGVAGGS
jgi:hypothetical protein